VVPLVFKTRLAVAERFNKPGVLAKAHRPCFLFSILHILHIPHKPSHGAPFLAENVHEVFTQPGGGEGAYPASGVRPSLRGGAEKLYPSSTRTVILVTSDREG